MAVPQLLNDIIQVLLQLAPAASLVAMVLAGISLRREGGTTFLDRRRLHQVDVLGDRVRNARDLCWDGSLRSASRHRCRLVVLGPHG